MSGKRLDARSKLGRAMFQMVDASQKLPTDMRTIVVRVRNFIESNHEDKMMRFTLRGDLDQLAKNSRLTQHVRLLLKCMPS